MTPDCVCLGARVFCLCEDRSQFLTWKYTWKVRAFVKSEDVFEREFTSIMCASLWKEMSLARFCIVFKELFYGLDFGSR